MPHENKTAQPEAPSEISWEALEYTHHQKGVLWYFIVGIIGISLIVFFIYHKEYITATLFFLLLAITILFSIHPPRLTQITINEKGLQIDSKIIPYRQILSFWILYYPPDVKTLNFETTAFLNRHLTIELDRQNPVLVRKLLLEFLPEDLEREENLTDRLARKMKL